MEDQIKSCNEDLGRVTTMLSIREKENTQLQREISDLHRRLDEGRKSQQVRRPAPQPAAPCVRRAWPALGRLSSPCRRLGDAAPASPNDRVSFDGRLRDAGDRQGVHLWLVCF